MTPCWKHGRRSDRAFTLVELMVAMSMTAVLLVAVLFAVVMLQHSYAATEAYATAQADQARLLDALALDLRRAVPTAAGAPPYAMDPDGQGLQINVPDYYQFSASDPQHLSPVAVRPSYDPTTGTAYYSSSTTPAASGAPPYRTIAYRFNAADGSITRSDPWQPLVAAGKSGYAAAAPQVLASNMEAFPTITPDPSDISGNTVHYAVAFHSIFQPLTTVTTGTDITLHNVTFIRSKNLSH